MTKLVLDPNGVIVRHGDEEVADSTNMESLVEIEGDCDLPLGKYRWDASAGTAIPNKAANSQRKDTLMKEKDAIWAGFAGIYMSGLVELPTPTVAWLYEFPATIDGSGVSKRTGVVLKLKEAK